MTRPVLRMLLPSAILLLAGCSDTPVAESSEPAVIDEIPGTELSRITLSDSAAQRLDIQIATVEQDGDQLMVPSAAVIIDAVGQYWVYTNPEPLVYIRAPLDEAWEEGTRSYFTGGVDPGTQVVVVGVPELYGAEYGIGK